MRAVGDLIVEQHRQVGRRRTVRRVGDADGAHLTTPQSRSLGPGHGVLAARVRPAVVAGVSAGCCRGVGRRCARAHA